MPRRFSGGAKKRDGVPMIIGGAIAKPAARFSRAAVARGAKKLTPQRHLNLNRRVYIEAASVRAGQQCAVMFSAPLTVLVLMSVAMTENLWAPLRSVYVVGKLPSNYNLFHNLLFGSGHFHKIYTINRFGYHDDLNAHFQPFIISSPA